MAVTNHLPNNPSNCKRYSKRGRGVDRYVDPVRLLGCLVRPGGQCCHFCPRGGNMLHQFGVRGVGALIGACACGWVQSQRSNFNLYDHLSDHPTRPHMGRLN